jgi:AraC family transcriptional regulator, chitin signaling transcriptional activator
MPKSLRKRLSCLVLLLSGALAATAQGLPEKGVPLLQSFSPAQYRHQGKIWDIRSAPNGIVYMAADKGLLEYDGKTWNNFSGSNGFTRALLVANDSLIYTGSDLDFGVWRKTQDQSFEYHSLYPFQEAVQDINEEFWEVHQLDEDIIFVSSQNIYVAKGEQLVKIAAPSQFTKSFRLQDTLYFADEKEGLYVFDGFSLEKVFGYPDNTRLEISGMYRQGSGLVIVTRDLGLYRYAAGKLSSLDHALSVSLKTAKVFCFEPIGSSRVAFGTVLKGLYIADLEGNIIHQINRYKGLPSNTVLSLHYSPAGKLWLGMDYGVAALDLNNNLTAFFDYRGDFGTGYAASLKDGNFYLGTNQGLYRSKWEELNNNLEFFKFLLVPQTAGQVWTLEDIGNTLLMGHDKGLFIVRENAVEKVSSQEGVWTILSYQDYLLTGNYNGISIFRKNGASWAFWKKMDLIYGSCNQLLAEQDNILWVNIPNFGIIRAVLDENLTPDERLIFPDKTFEGDEPFLLKDEQGIHLVTTRFRYVYDAAAQEFVQEGPAKALPGLAGWLPGVYSSRALHLDYEFHPTHNGFILKHLKSGDRLHEAGYALIFRKTEAFNNDERTTLYPEAKLPYRLNNFRIEFIVPNHDDVLYQYKLDGTGEWSDWDEDNAIELIGLEHGKYTFIARAKIDGAITPTSALAFSIAAPWHRSWPALAAYFALVLLAVSAMLWWRRTSLNKQKEKLLLKKQEALRLQAEQHEQELLLLEQKRLQAEYSQLKQQLRNKTIELANKAKENEEKNRLLLALKEKFETAQEKPSAAKMKWKEMERLLDSYLKVEDKTFEIQMDELHQEFFKKLKARFPALSSNDLRLCAYLKIGLSSKEIAEMLNIQPSSFYISRSRLRKKLELETDDNLYDFLNAI